MNLLAGTKLSTARDFRIEMKELKEALAENQTETQTKKKNRRDTTSAESNDSTNYSTMQQVSPRCIRTVLLRDSNVIIVLTDFSCGIFDIQCIAFCCQQSGISKVDDAGESSSSSKKGRKSLKRKRNNK